MAGVEHGLEVVEKHNYQFRDLYDKINGVEKNVVRISEKHIDLSQQVNLLDYRMENQEKLTQSISEMSAGINKLTNSFDRTLEILSDHSKLIDENSSEIIDLKLKPIQKEISIYDEYKKIFITALLSYGFGIITILMFGGN